MKTSKLLLKAIKQGLNDEAVGEAIYRKAAIDTKIVSTKKFFEKMANEEKQHIIYLKRLYQYIDKDTNSYDLIQDIRYNFAPTKEIFTKDFLNDISKSDALLLALNKSAELEKNSVKFYENCRDMVEDSQIKDFFASMTIWEKSHLNQILDIFENIDDNEINYKQDYF